MFRKILLTAVAAVIFSALGTVARADVIYLGPRVVQPSGQGVVPTVLTLQEKDPGPKEAMVGIAPGFPQ